VARDWNGQPPSRGHLSSRLFGWHILAYLDLSWLISSHIILFILPAEQPPRQHDKRPEGRIWMPVE
jgi:hypothetical protein